MADVNNLIDDVDADESKLSPQKMKNGSAAAGIVSTAAWNMLVALNRIGEGCSLKVHTDVQAVLRF